MNLIKMLFQKQTIYKIARNKKKLENKLKVKINIIHHNIEIKGDEPNIYIGEKVLEAIDKNFSVNIALLLLKEEYVLEDIPIKNITKRKDLSRIKARIIGTKGETLKILSELSDCHITLHNNTVSIIGQVEKIKEATRAIENLIRGSKQTNVYKYLERREQEEGMEDLGLKE